MLRSNFLSNLFILFVALSLGSLLPFKNQDGIRPVCRWSSSPLKSSASSYSSPPPPVTGGCGAYVLLIEKYNPTKNELTEFSASYCLTITIEGLGNTQDGYRKECQGSMLLNVVSSLIQDFNLYACNYNNYSKERKGSMTGSGFT